MHYYSFPDPMSGRFLRGLRQTMGLRQEKLAGMLGVNQSSLNRWEHGKYAIPSGIVRELEVIYRDFLADIVSWTVARTCA
ncbi:hypothetical protein ACU21_04195 [Actinobaculum suis]|nr:hypothetical protein ACU20_05970 [Actinobaculum suis]OCA95492.1 hypothetical protein ACU21_04195 [Actinobaculum suis]